MGQNCYMMNSVKHIFAFVIDVSMMYNANKLGGEIVTFEFDLVFVQARFMTSEKNGREFAIVKLANPVTYETFDVFAEDVNYVRSLTIVPGTPVRAEFVVRGGNRTNVALRRLSA